MDITHFNRWLRILKYDRIDEHIMKKRLRKKKRIGEFQEFCFRLILNFKKDSIDEPCEFIDSFVEEAIEKNGLQTGGGCTKEECDLIVERWRGSATEDDRKLVEAWIVENPLIERYYIGPLYDAWYGDSEEPKKEDWK